MKLQEKLQSQRLKWEAGERVFLTDILTPEELKSLDEEDLVNWIGAEIRLRKEFGNPYDLEEDYFLRWPNLKSRLERLLGLERGIVVPSPIERGIESDVMTRLAPPDMKPGDTIGPYRLLEEVGEGGMGSVWKAEQLYPVQRRVAIKLVKLGLDSRQVLGRFEAERQALAMMDHPNICRIFDGGITNQGRPYFVMEFVKGVPFTTYCDQGRLSLEGRLRLFISVCNAVQHAHLKGIVHRDLKPSNILICDIDGMPVPKIIDFGLAKAIHQPLTESTLFTAQGMLVGTPLYMSPEQAEPGQQDVDTRTDVYSLGVLLYEILTGTTPLERAELKRAAFNEIVRMIKEVEPPRPSSRLSSSNLLPSVAAQRGIDPKALRRTLAGDLDWVAMKAIEKARGRRYETANNLAKDVERFLNQEPVEACPPSVSYRFSKFVRRYRAQVYLGMAVFFLLVIGVIGTSWGLLRALEAEQDARESDDKTKIALESIKKESLAKNAALLEVVAQRNEAEKYLIRGLLKPIGYNQMIMDQAEMSSFVEWSALSSPRLQLAVFEHALTTPETALRVSRRADWVIQAVVGLSPKRRSQVLELVTKLQYDRKVNPAIRAATCWMAVEIGSDQLPALDETVRFLAVNNPKILIEFLNFTQECSTPGIRAELNRVLPVTLLDVLEQTNELELQQTIGIILTELSKSIPDAEVVRAWKAQLQIHKEANSPKIKSGSYKALELLSFRLDESMVESEWKAHIANLATSEESGSVRASGAALVSLVPRLDQQEISKQWEETIVHVAAAKHPLAMESGGEVLEALGNRLTDPEVSKAIEYLLAAMESAEEDKLSETGCKGIAAVASMISPELSMTAWKQASKILKETEEFGAINVANSALAALAPRLDSSELLTAWNLLWMALTEGSDEFCLEEADTLFTALAARLMPQDVVQIQSNLIESLSHNDPFVVYSAGVALGALASKMGEPSVLSTWQALIDALKTPSSDAYLFDCLEGVLIGLVKVSKILPEPERKAALDKLLAVIKSTRDNFGLLAALEIATDHEHLFEENQERSIWNTAIQTMGKSERTNVQNLSTRALSAIGKRMDDSNKAVALKQVLDLIQTTKDTDLIGKLEPVLLAFLDPLGPSLVPGFHKDLSQLIQKSTNRNVISAASRAYVKIIPMLDPSDQIKAIEFIISHTPKGCSSDCFTEIWGLLEAEDRDRMADLATRSTLNRRYGVREAAAGILKTKTIAQLLSHPGCVGESRKMALMRLEELAFHDGKPVFLDSVKVPDREQKHPARRFHTVHDAAKWIQVNLPEIDLEVNATTSPKKG